MPENDVQAGPILVVDDEDLIRMNLAAYLEDEDFDIECANSGEEALSLIESQAYAVGIIDMRLPGINGNELILRASQKRPEMKFLIHTGSTEYRLPDGLKELGIEDEHVLLKPLSNMDDLVQLLETLLDSDA